VVVPCYRVRDSIADVLRRIGPEVSKIYVVDDCCPDGTGDHVEATTTDTRISVVRNQRNLGVGGATKAGFQSALQDGIQIVVKLDGDGQMDPAQIPRLIEPICSGRADYVKGNRFYDMESVRSMPPLRKIGNAAMSLLSKVASGYWSLMDPTNGFVAIETSVLPLISLNKVADGYFFESDILFRLNTVGAVVAEVPMEAIYGDEKSHLSEAGAALRFPGKFVVRFVKRIVYTYYLRDFNACSVEIIFGMMLLIFGVVFGGYQWYVSLVDRVPATTGTVMLAALPVILGFQLMLSALNHDVSRVLRDPLHLRFQRARVESDSTH
jgi:glycosyltransferase involved in cell wall biosynthesis